jgi:ABC-type transporter Mla maintaining outer membrane lipid asymmetry ATPase subunit MlaF
MSAIAADEHPGADSSVAQQAEPIALAYQPARDADGAISITAGGSHYCRLDFRRKALLVAAVLELKPETGARLVVLGRDVAELRVPERRALRARVGFLPAEGGLLSHLNGWENIVLPLGFHRMVRPRTVAARVYRLLVEQGAEPETLLAKLPEEMTLMEKKLTGCIRTLLEAPELILADDFSMGLDSAQRAQAAGMVAAYHAICPHGTFVQFEGAPEG